MSYLATTAYADETRLREDDTTDACPAGVSFCDGGCPEWDDAYHSSGFTFVDAENARGALIDVSVSVSRVDVDGVIGDPRIHFLAIDAHDDVSFTPEQARRAAAALLNGADMADPLPTGTLHVDAGNLRLGDQLLTADGWQTIRGLMFFSRPAQVSVFTDERTDSDSDGWQLDPADPVQVRRAMHQGATR